jgi:FkbM family methyltransferase
MNTINKFINYLYFGNYFRNKFYKELKFLSKYIPPHAYILEAGAHTGSDTVSMAHAFKGSTIFAFEPEPNAYRKLIRKTSGYENVHTYPLALGNENGTKTLFVSKNRLDASSSLLPQSEFHRKMHPSINLEETIEVEISTLDSWAHSNHVDHIDFMWLDMQGGELSALKSSKKILPTVQAIYTEVLISPTYTDAPLYSEFKEWMKKEGFIVELERDVSTEQANVLFVRK